MNIAEKILFGVAVGDAIGVPVEFSTRAERKIDPVIDMREYGTYNQPKGTWSDDSSMTFCIADALCGEFSLETIALNFVAWVDDNFWSPHGYLFDIGNSTQKAISKIKWGLPLSQTGGDDYTSNGNGSLMRTSPLALYVKDMPIEQRFKVVSDVSAITHAHSFSRISCFYYVEFMLQLMMGRSKWDAYENLRLMIPAFFAKNKMSLDKLLCVERLLFGHISDIAEDDINSDGYTIDTLEASIWCLLSTKNYSDAVLKAVNLGSDTDTTGAVTGGLAGLYYGFDSIPTEWVDVIARKGDIEVLAERLNKKYEN